MKVTRKHVVATSAKQAWKKASGKRIVVTKVNYIKGSKKGKKKTYDVITKKKK
jgi:hypothetical protein